MNIKPAPRTQKSISAPESAQTKRRLPQSSRLGCILTVVLTCVAVIFTGNIVASIFPPSVYGDNQWSNLGALVARLGLAFAVVGLVVGGLLYLLFAKLLPPKDDALKTDNQGK
jgi:hypothetical protein